MMSEDFAIRIAAQVAFFEKIGSHPFFDKGRVPALADKADARGVFLLRDGQVFLFSDPALPAL